MKLLDIGDIVLKVFVPLELYLHLDNVLRVADLAVVHSFEVFLKLVKLGTELLPFGLDLGEALLRLLVSLYVVFAFVFFLLYLFSRVLGWIVAERARRLHFVVGESR